MTSLDNVPKYLIKTFWKLSQIAAAEREYRQKKNDLVNCINAARN